MKQGIATTVTGLAPKGTEAKGSAQKDELKLHHGLGDLAFAGKQNEEGAGSIFNSSLLHIFLSLSMAMTAFLA